MPDLIGWRMYENMRTDDIIHFVSSYSYEKKVFFLSPWEEIYKQDKERPYTYKEACEISNKLYDSYATLGYSLISIPQTSIQERVEIVRKNII